MRANSGEALSSRVPSGWILFRNDRRNSVKSTIWSESARTPCQSDFIFAGGCSAISRHSAARSTTRITSRISVVSSAAPAIRDFSTSGAISERPEKSNRPPTRRNSRISLASSCWLSIQSRSVDGTSAAIRSCPRGEEAYPRRRSRKESNSSTRAELWISSLAIAIHGTGAERRHGDGKLERRKIEEKQNLRAQSPPAPATCTADPTATGNLTTNSAPPSGLFWQVICPL